MKDLEAKVAAAVPDQNKQKELEKNHSVYKKGTICGEGLIEKSVSFTDRGVNGYSFVPWDGHCSTHS